MPINANTYYTQIPPDFKGNTRYIPRYNDCYILHRPLGTTYATEYQNNATNKFVTTPVIYFDTGQSTEDGLANRSATGYLLKVYQLGTNPIGIGTLATRGLTLLSKYGADGDNDVAGNLKYSTSGNTYILTNGRTYWITAGHAFALGIPNGVTGATGTYTFYVKNQYTNLTAASPADPTETYLLWRVQFCFGSRDGTNMYYGEPLIMDGHCGYADIISRGNSGGTYFHDFDNLAIPYGQSGFTKARTHPSSLDGADPDPGNWRLEYTP